MALALYATDAARRFTAAALDAGEQPSAASAILKVHLTEAGRRAINDGMDILGGKGIMRGPHKRLGVAYRHAPIAITVEGANLMTRALIIFDQGALRCHQYMLKEMDAIVANDTKALNGVLLSHAGQAPADLRFEAEQIAPLSAQFALTADLAMGLLGGKLKRLELLTARLGDVLSALYLAACSVWRCEADTDTALLPIARAAIQVQLEQAAQTLRELHANLPRWPVALLSPALHGGMHHLRTPDDRLLLELSESLRTDARLMQRLCPDMGRPKSDGLLNLMHALEATKPLDDEVVALNRAARKGSSFADAAATARDPVAALSYQLAADRVIQMDDFAPV